MKYISLSTINIDRNNGIDDNNQFFSLNRSWIYNYKRDDKNRGFILLKKKLFSNKIILNTSDIKTKKQNEIDIQYGDATKIINKNNFLLLPEHYLINPKNKIKKIKHDYKRIYCQFDRLIDNKKIFKLNTPFSIKPVKDKEFFSRKYFSVMIASNKSCLLKSNKIMYQERFKTIKWFENNHPNEFFLFGKDWDLPNKENGMSGRIYNYINKFIKIKKNLRCHKGTIKNKFLILKNTRFNFCYENINEDGYISDIIFDSFNNGCVPVYMGPNNINKYIPESCFVNVNNFKNHEDLFDYLKDFTIEDYNKIYQNIIKYYKKGKFDKFSSEFIVKKLVRDIKKFIK